MLLPGVKPGWNTEKLEKEFKSSAGFSQRRGGEWLAQEKTDEFFFSFFLFFIFFKYHKIFSANVELTYVHVVSGLGSSDSISLFIAGVPAARRPAASDESD